MNRRLLFLSGHLTGLLVGAALMWFYFSNTSAKTPGVATLPGNPVVIPASYQTFPRAPSVAPLPDEWELRHFNGQPYYLVPVQTEGGDAEI